MNTLVIASRASKLTRVESRACTEPSTLSSLFNLPYRHSLLNPGDPHSSLHNLRVGSSIYKIF